MNSPIDIGNLHVIDYYLCQNTKDWFHSLPPSPISTRLDQTYDFDIETEQREGWAYDD